MKRKGNKLHTHLIFNPMTEPLTLTEGQKGKLIAMATVIFHGQTIFCTGKDDMVFIKVGMDGKQIHWFEFCFTVLAEKVIKYNHQKMGDLSYTTMIGTMHPVAFLWNVMYE